MEPYTLLTVVLIALVAAGVLVTAGAWAVALGILPDGPGTGAEADTDANGERRGREDGARNGTDGGDDAGDGITDADRERIRRHLAKSPDRRRPDDLLPSDADDTDSEGS
ncbi:hypothetical protein [Haloplanus pelagicus]|jgi:hypothetical protein|uniref:hypothetical protein n=1 Tax=Haloplanus pelagicus TaxID=2949995 RepID=UPI0020414CE1|nr:hypothetical protein [Haloplanus sp. HW8-1]